MTTRKNGLALYSPRSERKVNIPELESVRNRFQNQKYQTMIQFLTSELLERDRVVSAFLLMSENLGGEFRERYVHTVLRMTGADQVLELFLMLKKARVNSRFATRFMLRYLWQHPYLYEMACFKPAVIRDILEHTLGRNTARGAVARLRVNPNDETATRTLTGGYALEINVVLAVIRTIYHFESTEIAAPKKRYLYKKFHEAFREKIVSSTLQQKTVTVTTRGKIAASLVYIYEGSSEEELRTVLEQKIEEIARLIPVVDANVALVLDLSRSTLGVGDRKYGCVSQSVVFSKVLERVCRLAIFPVGRMDVNGKMLDPPIPSGSTDLASALIKALEARPDQIVIVSDGYENVLGGDLDFVIQRIPEKYASIPITFVHSMFTEKDSLDRRRPTTRLPELFFWHENDFVNVCVSLFHNAPMVEDKNENKEKKEILESILAVL